MFKPGEFVRINTFYNNHGNLEVLEVTEVLGSETPNVKVRLRGGVRGQEHHLILPAHYFDLAPTYVPRFKRGDVVKLKSGSPDLTVVVPDSRTDDKVMVQWHSEDKGFQTTSLPTDLLKPVDNSCRGYIPPEDQVSLVTASPETNGARQYITDQQMWAISHQVVRRLAGLPVGEALHILQDMAPRLIKDGLTVDLSHPRYQAQAAELSIPLGSTE